MTDRTATARSEANIPTEHASKYLQQLCKHFAHKRPVVFDEHKGQISLLTGECHLVADGPHLIVTVVAEDDGRLPQLEDVIVRHLVRFAFREELPVDWKRLE